MFVQNTSLLDRNREELDSAVLVLIQVALTARGCRIELDGRQSHLDLDLILALELSQRRPFTLSHTLSPLNM